MNLKTEPYLVYCFEIRNHPEMYSTQETHKPNRCLRSVTCNFVRNLLSAGYNRNSLPLRTQI